MMIKDVTWELLNKYRQAELTIISEYSIAEEEDIEELDKECQSYISRIEDARIEEIMKVIDEQMMAHLNAAFDAIDKKLDIEYVFEKVGACKALAAIAARLGCITARELVNVLWMLWRVCPVNE